MNCYVCNYFFVSFSRILKFLPRLGLPQEKNITTIFLTTHQHFAQAKENVPHSQKLSFGKITFLHFAQKQFNYESVIVIALHTAVHLFHEIIGEVKSQPGT